MKNKRKTVVQELFEKEFLLDPRWRAKSIKQHPNKKRVKRISTKELTVLLSEEG